MCDFVETMIAFRLVNKLLFSRFFALRCDLVETYIVTLGISKQKNKQHLFLYIYFFAHKCDLVETYRVILGLVNIKLTNCCFESFACRCVFVEAELLRFSKQKMNKTW